MQASEIAGHIATVSSRRRLFSTGVRLGVICDLVEENWPSMDLVGDMLLAQLHTTPPPGIKAERIRPSMSRRFQWAGYLNPQFAYSADRFVNRFWDYPKFMRRCRESFDLFHLIDHSYAQLLLELPSGGTVVTCHDIETFRCLLEPDSRSALFRAMVRRTLRGLRRAAVVVCPSMATRDALQKHDLIPQERLRVVPLGTHPSCSPQSDLSADLAAVRLLGQPYAGQADLLHVGSTVPRKRIDALLRIFAQVKKHFPGVRLVHVGGDLTSAQESIVDELQLRDSVVVLPWLDRRVLAAVYRRAAAVLLPSEREGFGLPVVEALACGTPVVASDAAALRETGGDCAVYCSIDNLDHWTEAISALLRERQQDPDGWNDRCNRAVVHASRFTWARYTQRMVAIYRELLAGMTATSREFAS